MVDTKKSKKSVFITGCSHGGMGDALAQEFHRRGLQVFASARNLTKTTHLVAMGIQVVELDVLDDNAIKAAVKVVAEATGGRLDYLINNAGIELCCGILDTDFAKAKLLFDTNLWSVITITKAFTPLLEAAKGTVVNHSSVGSMVCMPFLGVYSASKAGLDQISDAMRMELCSVGVSVVILSTAGVRTRMLENREPMHVPEGSIFAHNKAEVEKLKNEEQVVGITADAFAKTIVNKLLKNSKPMRIWGGESAGSVWFMLAFFPQSLIDWFVIRLTGAGPYFKYQNRLK
ncbi:hypothetical protein H072_9123 [Dactylellina haptotyla CBS 200.50]|uniref:NAD(P)-binding protein n=1 Tax=Dactylellina haptotyla (strain CBS 200.50) TaxID=1284197 RepID=S8BDC6_DACHA|nr:hypothetical protein H072_9123 [Dactylellina haptotyla CBS 200.50]